MPSDTYILTISDSGVSVPAIDSVTNTSVADNAAIAFSKLASLTSGNILVGNSNNVPTSVAVTGDVTISNTGATSIASGAIVNADINASAGISHSKLATTSAGNVLLGNNAGAITATPITGDITISSTGVASIANDASIAFSKIMPVTGDISISNSGVASIASGAVVNADINSSAAIAHSKLATTTAGNVLLGNNAGFITATPITGDITVSSSGISSITNDAVTFSKIQNISDYQILGRNSGTGIGDVQSISCTPFAFSLLNDGDAATARTTLGISVPAAGIVTSDGTNFSSVTVLPATNGGTGQSSYAVGDLLYANTTTSVAKLADVATGSVLLSGGLNVAPSYGKVGLTTHVTGILPVANGGTGYGSDGIGTLSFDTTPDTGTALTEGQLRWNTTDKTLDLKMTGANVTQQIGQELLMRVHASTSITNGDVVYISGSNSGLPAVSKASASDVTAKKTLALATEDIASGSDGYVTLYGIVRGLNLSGYTNGQEVWLSATAGAITGTEPSYPLAKVRVGYVVSATDGIGALYSAPKFYENGTVNGTGKIGYLTGSGSSETQSTSKSTGVTLNKTNGQITMNGEALAQNTSVSFTLTNSKIEAGDILITNHISGGTLGNYLISSRSAAGSATINVRNVSGGSLSDAVVIAFAVIKAVTT